MDRGLVHISVVLRDAFDAIAREMESDLKTPEDSENPQEAQEPKQEDAQ